MLRCDIKKLRKGCTLPTRASAEAAGFDLYACLEKEVILPPSGGRVLIPTGFCMKLPGGTEAQIRPRSGLAYKHGITVLNAPGTIDSDYRGEVKILLVNLDMHNSFTIKHGMRIAQMVIASLADASIHEVDNLDDTERGAGGFGSTGLE